MKVINKEIDVLAYHFRGKSYPVPVKMKVLSENGEYNIINIAKLISHYEEKKAGILTDIYLCQTVNSSRNEIIPFELRYDRHLRKWFLYKI